MVDVISDLTTVPRARFRLKLKDLLVAGIDELSSKRAFHYQKHDLRGQSPVLVITSSQSMRPPLTTQGKRPGFQLAVFYYVRHYDKDANWTEENAEDMLDLLEQRTADVLNENTTLAGYWQSLEHEATLIERIKMGGFPYLVEIIPVTFEV